MGSPRFLTLDTQSFWVTEAWFEPGVVLEPHTHDRPILSVMLRGGFRTSIAGRSLDCHQGIAWTEPRGEQHANYAGPNGAQVVVIQPDAAKTELLAPFAGLLTEVHRLREPSIVLETPRILRELHERDDLNELCLDALVITVLADAVRARFRDSNRGRRPGWLTHVRDLLHDDWRRFPTLSELASAAGVHPCYLARTFRHYFGESVGSYARKLRMTWALSQLEVAELPISQIAADAGFTDQPHFTRECRRHLGITPGGYRARVVARRS
jgi:AraC family transcriptional regulator